MDSPCTHRRYRIVGRRYEVSALSPCICAACSYCRVCRFIAPTVPSFLFACIGLIPLAGLLGEATEALAVYTGPRIGGLLNATLGNAAELIITIVALKAGKVDLVKASITGSILGNLLLILGFSLLLGGLKNGVQRFDRNLTGMSATMMMLAVIGLIIPTMLELVREVQFGTIDLFDTSIVDPALDSISLGVAGILIVLYILSLVYTLRLPNASPEEQAEAAEEAPHWSLGVSITVLLASTLAIVFLSELLVGAIEPVVESLGVSELFLGIIVIPIVGNVAEHIVGVQMAIKNKMDLSLTISLGSSMQVALFVAPLLVFISLLFGREMTLFFSFMEVIALGLAVLTATLIASDGESNWLEGAQLLAVYLIVALGFYYIQPVG